VRRTTLAVTGRGEQASSGYHTSIRAKGDHRGGLLLFRPSIDDLITRSKNALRRIPLDTLPHAARVHLLNRT
jgi:hypothetical protein